jgi:hypothetical protein
MRIKPHCVRLFPHEVLNKEKALDPTSASADLFVSLPLLSKLSSVQKQKIPVFSHRSFFFVAECDEISNLDLRKNIDKIIKMIEVLNM